MTFGSPWVLWFLAIPVMLVATQLRGRSARVTVPLDHSDVRSWQWLGWLVNTASLIPSLLMAVAIMMLAEPLIEDKPTAERVMTNIDFVLDLSSSMTSPFESGSRYDAAMKAINEFAKQRRGDAFGLTVFGNEVLEWTPLTQDLSVISNAAPFLRPEKLPSQFGGTEIGKAIQFCNRKLAKRGEGDRLLILLSDGISSDLANPKADMIGKELKANQIVLYAIHIGDSNPPEDLNSLVRPTGGEVFGAKDQASIRRIFAHIEQMQPIKMQPKDTRRIYNYAPFAMAGLVLVALQLGAQFHLRYTPW
jgi:Ca-activated chloride channel homolog